MSSKTSLINFKEIEKPFKLSQISKHFGFRETDLLKTLEKLAMDRKIFFHDVEKCGTQDLKLSIFCCTSLIIKHNFSKDTLKELAVFYRKHKRPIVGEHLSQIYLGFLYLTAETTAREVALREKEIIENKMNFSTENSGSIH